MASYMARDSLRCVGDLVKGGARYFHTSTIKCNRKVPKLNISEFEVRKAQPSDLPSVVKFSDDVLGGADFYPGMFLKLVNMKNAENYAIVHKPTNTLAMGITNLEHHCPPLSSVYGKYGRFNKRKFSEEESKKLSEIYNLTVHTAPEYRTSGIAAYFTNRLTSEQIERTQGAIRASYITYFNQFGLSPNTYNGEPETTVLSGEKALLFEITPEKIESFAEIAKSNQGLASGSTKEDKALREQLASLRVIPMERTYPELIKSPYLSRLLHAGRYLMTEYSPIPFDQRNFVSENDPFGSINLVGSGAKGIDSLSNSVVFWSTNGVVVCQHFTGFNEVQLSAHIIRAVSEVKQKIMEEFKLHDQCYGEKAFKKQRKIILNLFFSINLNARKADSLVSKGLGLPIWSQASTRDEVSKFYLLDVYPEHALRVPKIAN